MSNVRIVLKGVRIEQKKDSLSFRLIGLRCDTRRSKVSVRIVSGYLYASENEANNDMILFQLYHGPPHDKFPISFKHDWLLMKADDTNWDTIRSEVEESDFKFPTDIPLKRSKASYSNDLDV